MVPAPGALSAYTRRAVPGAPPLVPFLGFHIKAARRTAVDVVITVPPPRPSCTAATSIVSVLGRWRSPFGPLPGAPPTHEEALLCPPQQTEGLGRVRQVTLVGVHQYR